MPFKKIIFPLICLIFISCSSKKENDLSKPIGVLQQYISTSFSIKEFEEKEKLLNLATGDVRNILEKLDEEQFKKFFSESNRQFVSLKIKDERKVGETEYSVTYELTFINKKQESESTVNNKKHALFKLVDGKWLIAEVKNLKTFIEYKNEMSF